MTVPEISIPQKLFVHLVDFTEFNAQLGKEKKRLERVDL